ncbi:nuclear transport factor 2 family protein [Actinopolymorpha sp. B9G3]|uniref:nuclear transport factor 2 family protein n=2 Tax=unclassified Actinopolymorpha TaxID=2627063 RepID=UPI0032D9ABD8
MAQGMPERLVRAYFDGWLAADRDAILATLHPACVVIESYGPVYRGIDQVARWIDGWLAPGNRVTRWDITALDATSDACFAEWDFQCRYDGELGGFEGATVARRSGDKLAYLREYAITAPRYDWQG